MNRFVLLLACALTTFAVIAAEPVKKKKSSHDAVSAPTSSVRPWEPTPFIQEGNQLPAGYRGVNTKQFFDMFRSKLEALKKQELETSQEYAQRTQDKIALLAPINAAAAYAFISSGFMLTYDADIQAYTVSNSVFCGVQEWTGGRTACKVVSISDDETYTGVTGLGAVIPIKREIVQEFSIIIPSGHPLLAGALYKRNYSDEYGYKYQFSVPLAKARDLKGMRIGTLLVGQVGEAALLSNHRHWGARTDDIFEPKDLTINSEAIPFNLKKIIFYVVQTGEILDQQLF